MGTRVCVGVVVGAHGVRGAVRLKSFTDRPADIGAYGPVEDKAAGRQFELRVIGEAKGLVIARLDGIEDRDAAEGLKGVELFVDRERLPRTEEDEFLYADLIGLRALGTEGSDLGKVSAVFDFGAGPLLEIKGSSGTLLVPFSKEAVPEVDVTAGRVMVEPWVWAAEDKDEGEA